MPDPAFLVEGRMEQVIVQRLCPGKPVRLLGCNSDTAPLAVIARFADAQMRQLKNYYPVIIILDREKRTQSCDEVRIELTKHLDDKGHSGQFVVGVADHMTENWILASWSSICAERSDHIPYDGNTESVDGKNTLRRLLPPGSIYHETTVGVELFLSCDVRLVYQRSASFRRFVDDTSTLRCPWLSGARAERA